MSAVIIPPPAIDMSQLCADLVDVGAVVAARLVREGRREYADTIIEELDDVSEVITAHVRAWGDHRDAAILASNATWHTSHGCEACALAALASGDATTRCDPCVEFPS